jgi:hypothetical protein
MDQYEKLKDLVAGLEQDFSDFYGKGNKAAGRRIRKAMQEMKGLAQEVRVDVQARINAAK